MLRARREHLEHRQHLGGDSATVCLSRLSGPIRLSGPARTVKFLSLVSVLFRLLFISCFILSIVGVIPLFLSSPCDSLMCFACCLVVSPTPHCIYVVFSLPMCQIVYLFPVSVPAIVPRECFSEWRISVYDCRSICLAIAIPVPVFTGSSGFDATCLPPSQPCQPITQICYAAIRYSV